MCEIATKCGEFWSCNKQNSYHGLNEISVTIMNFAQLGDFGLYEEGEPKLTEA